MTGFMLTSLVALIITVGAFGLYDRATFEEEALEDTSVLAGIIGENAVPSLLFNDDEGAKATLAALRAKPDVLAAHLFDKEGRLFASYSGSASSQPPSRVPADGRRIEPRMITVTKPVLFNGNRVGTVHLQSGLGALQERRRKYLLLSGVVLAAAAAVALILSWLFGRAISRPILHLLEAEKRVSREKNYDVHVERQANDEVGMLIDGFNDMLREIRARDAEIEERHAQEMALARSIQTSVLPRTFDFPGFDISAVMMPAEEVGGDFYEFRAVDGGAWIGIGDVTGHGVTSGLIMMMAQSMFTMLCENSNGQVSPAKFISLMNRAMFYNLRSRLDQDKFMTMVVAKIDHHGKMTYAGAHTDVLVYRATTKTIERLPTDGIWLGISEDIEAATTNRTLNLGRGDIALFHTDGVTEARNRAGECFDMNRLAQQLAELQALPAAELVTRIAQTAWSWAGTPADDVSLLAVKRS